MNRLKKICVACSAVAIISGINIHSALAKTGTVSSETVRVREEASTSSKILINLDLGDEVEIISEDGDWYKVKYKTYEGYMHKDYVKVENDEDVPEKNETNSDDTKIDELDNISTSENTQTQKKVNYIGVEIEVKKDSDIYLLPILSSSKVDDISSGTNVKGIQETNNWVKISYSGNTGWISKNSLSEEVVDSQEPVTNNDDTTTNNDTNTDENNDDTNNSDDTSNSQTSNTSSRKKGYINVAFANIRAKASSDSDVLISLEENTEVTILGEENDFYKITSEKVKEGYIAKRLISEEKVTSRSADIRTEKSDEENEEEVISSNIEITSNTSSGQEIVNFAEQFLGYDYVYGGTNPSNGFDCSGYTYYVYSNSGIDISRSLSSQAEIGEEVSEDEIQVGDLIIFMDEGMSGIGHSGIYIGDNQFIHAANPSRGVVTDSINSSYYGPRIVTIRRLV